MHTGFSLERVSICPIDNERVTGAHSPLQDPLVTRDDMGLRTESRAVRVALVGTIFPVEFL